MEDYIIDLALENSLTLSDNNILKKIWNAIKKFMLFIQEKFNMLLSKLADKLIANLRKKGKTYADSKLFKGFILKYSSEFSLYNLDIGDLMDNNIIGAAQEAFTTKEAPWIKYEIAEKYAEKDLNDLRKSIYDNANNQPNEIDGSLVASVSGFKKSVEMINDKTKYLNKLSTSISSGFNTDVNTTSQIFNVLVKSFSHTLSFGKIMLESGSIAFQDPSISL